jgi:hypothetical protein
VVELAADRGHPIKCLAVGQPLLALDQIEHAAAGTVLVVEPNTRTFIDCQRALATPSRLARLRLQRIRITK